MSTPVNHNFSVGDYSSHLQAKAFLESHAKNLTLSGLRRYGPVKKAASVRPHTSVFSALFDFNGTQSDADNILKKVDACSDLTTVSGCAQCKQSLNFDVCRLFAIAAPNSLLHGIAHSQVVKERPPTFPPPNRVSEAMVCSGKCGAASHHHTLFYSFFVSIDQCLSGSALKVIIDDAYFVCTTCV